MGASPSSLSFYLAKRDFPLGARDRRRHQPFLFFSFLFFRSPRAGKKKKKNGHEEEEEEEEGLPSSVCGHFMGNKGAGEKYGIQQN